MATHKHQWKISDTPYARAYCTTFGCDVEMSGEEIENILNGKISVEDFDDPPHPDHLSEKQAECEHLSTYIENTRREFCADCDLQLAEFD